MDLSGEMIGGLLILFISMLQLIVYAFKWRIDICNIKKRLMQIEKEMHRQEKTYLDKPQIGDLIYLRPILPEKNGLDSTEMIRQYVYNYYPTFMDTLARYTCDKLTPNDELLCMMLKLEYSNKEIATILSITTNSVITARYRLKKKLLLTPNQQIDEWIQGITCL